MHTLINRNEFNLRTLCIYKNDFAECYLTAHKVKFCLTIPKGKHNFFLFEKLSFWPGVVVILKIIFNKKFFGCAYQVNCCAI